MIKKLLAVFILITLGWTSAALAVKPDEVLSDPLLETRARAISSNLRCLVCQNQSIDDSDAELARDLRLLVRERLLDGATDTEVIDYVVARYGEFVLLRPVWAAHTVVLWVAAPVVLLLSLVMLFFFNRNRKRPAPDILPTLKKEEQDAIDALMKDKY